MANKKYSKEFKLEALTRREAAPGLLFHSDRGSHYASQAFQDHLKGYGISKA